MLPYVFRLYMRKQLLLLYGHNIICIPLIYEKVTVTIIYLMIIIIVIM